MATPRLSCTAALLWLWAGSAAAVTVPASAETEPLPDAGAANEVAIWLHPSDLSRSVVIAADEKAGLGTYALDGGMLDWYPEGQTMFVDVRYRVPFAGAPTDIVLAGKKSPSAMLLYRMDPDTLRLVRLPGGSLPVGLSISGGCLYRSPIDRRLYAFVDNSSGQVEQHELFESQGQLAARKVRTFALPSAVDGCVADDELGALFVSEESTGVWELSAEPDGGASGTLVAKSQSLGGELKPDVEGVALTYGKDQTGYLVVASQSDDSLVVYDRRPPHAFRLKLTVGASGGIDSVSDPEGVDLVAMGAGAFPGGLVAVQDSSNEGGTTNFKLVSWAAVVGAADGGLVLDTTVDRRRVGELPAPSQDGGAAASLRPLPVVPAMETAVLPRLGRPVVWLHPTQLERSLLIVGGKTDGLFVTDLDGQPRQALREGDLPAPDLRYGYPLGGELRALVAVVNRADHTLRLFSVNPRAQSLEPAGEPIPLREGAQMSALYKSASGKTYAWVADDTQLEQLELVVKNGKVVGEWVRGFPHQVDAEGIAADDAHGAVYLSGEKGLWKFDAEPSGSSQGVAVATPGPQLSDGAEGVALYEARDGEGYLLVADQGPQTIVVFDRKPPHRFRASLKVIASSTIDGVEKTGRLAAVAVPVGAELPEGFLLVQDKLENGVSDHENFKLVRWGEIARAAGLETVDPAADPRGPKASGCHCEASAGAGLFALAAAGWWLSRRRRAYRGAQE